MKGMPYSDADWEEVKDKTTKKEKLLWQIFEDFPPIEELRARTDEQVEELKRNETTRELPPQRVSNALDVLTPRERQAIELRNGIKDGQPRTQVKTGEEMGCSATTVRRIEKKALEKLRRMPPLQSTH